MSNSNINQAIIAATSAAGVTICQPGIYTGSAEEFSVFNYGRTARAYTDDADTEGEYFVQLHYCCPHNFDSMAKRAALRTQIKSIFGSSPNEVDASDGDGQHHVFEFYALEGDIWQE